METAIEVRDLHQSYGDFAAVRGVSFAIRPGEVFALLGTNGAGKTTTLDVIEGYERAGSGDVRVLGADPYEQRDRVRARMGIVLQDGGFYNDLTVAETVDAWRRWTPSAMPRTEALALVGLDGRASVRVGRLSGGEKRRLDLALAALGRPDVLFLDEPTTGLDPEARRGVWDLIRELSGEGATVLLTTHYLDEAQRLADRLAIMNEGRIAAEGTVREILARRAPRIAFGLPMPSELPLLPGASATYEGDHVVIEARDVQRTLRELLDWAERRGLELTDLEVTRPSLEEIFLEVAG
ncbi:ABC transporter ATP-binding protein [Actinoallomurus sp. NPDC050550]|uniref:ABC transporter ATP-binding protein n=1 Tax=Actinoallomurus sp. NPDC050550 TaxID=3154937 RepID=UPI00340AAE2D